MPTLNINGQRVTVDDSFLALSPEQQNATVDEIASSMKPERSTYDKWTHDTITGKIWNDFSTKAGALLSGKTPVMDPVTDRPSDTAVGFGADTAQLFSPGAPASIMARKAAPVAVDAAKEAVSPVVEAATRQGIDLPRAAASDNPLIQQAGAVAANVPWAGAPMRQGAETAIKQIDELAGKTATSVGSGNAAAAGNAAREGIVQTVKPKTGGLATQTEALYKKVDELAKPDVLTPLDATRNVVADIGLKRYQGALDGPGKAAGLVQTAIERPQGLTYEGLKTLRTSIGEQMDSGILPEGMSGAELKRIYGALSQDLEKAVANAGGPEALSAWKTANGFAASAAAKRTQLAKIVGAKGDATDAVVFDRLAAMAGSSSRADLKSLLLAKQSMPKDAWGELQSGVIARLGRPAEDAPFSADRFVTGWQKLSTSGKKALFGGNKELVQALDDIATLSTRMKSLNKFANPSGTAQNVMGGAIGTSAFFNPIHTVATMVGASMVSRVLSQPVTARAVATYGKRVAVAKTPTEVNAAQRALMAILTRELAMGVPANDVAGVLKGAADQRGEDQRARRAY